jgi:uncharacterized membrane protein
MKETPFVRSDRQIETSLCNTASVAARNFEAIDDALAAHAPRAPGMPLTRQLLLLALIFVLVDICERHALGIPGVARFALDVGGAIVPICLWGLLGLGVTRSASIATALASTRPLRKLGILVAVATGAACATSAVNEFGVGTAPWLPWTLVGTVAFVMAKQQSVFVAFAAGVIGCFVGGDILHVWAFRVHPGCVAVMGGMGVVDAAPIMGFLAVSTAGVLNLLEEV